MPEAPQAPAEYAPNKLELGTIDEANSVISEIYESLAEDSDGGVGPYASDGELGDPPVLVRDPEISKLAQYGAGKLVERFPEMLGDSYSGNFISLIDPYSGYSELSVCGPAPLSIEDIGTAYRENPGTPGSIGDIHYSSKHALLSYEQPLIGVGYAEADGLACSYALVRSANYPFR